MNFDREFTCPACGTELTISLLIGAVLHNDDGTHSTSEIQRRVTNAYELHTANLQTERAYLREQAFDRKLSDREQATIDRLDAVIAERLGIHE